MTRIPCIGILFILAVCLLPAAATAQQALPTDGPTTARMDDDEATFIFEAASAGVLSIAVRGEGDLTVEVTDGDGQVLPEGSSDRDLFGDLGTEQLSVVIGEAGTYRVRVRQLDEATEFQIAAGWIDFPPFERTPDPDGRPTLATAVEIGEAHEDALDTAAGDAHDWYVLTPATDGVLTVVLRSVGDDVDLILEGYVGGFSEPTERSDQDLQDDRANEAVTLNVTAGEPVHVKVLGFGTSTSGRYRLATSFIN